MRFLYYTCREDFDCLCLSARSVLRVFPKADIFYAVDGGRFSSVESAEMTRIGAEFVDMPYTGMIGGENIAKMASLTAEVATGADYITKIDSDMLLFSDGFRTHLNGSFVTVGVAGGYGGLAGAMYSIRSDAAKWLGEKANDVSRFTDWLISLTQKPVLQEDFAMTMGIQSWFEEPHIAQVADGQCGFMGFYKPGCDMGEMALRFDSVHFGDRRAARAKAGVYAIEKKPRCADQIAEWMREASCCQN